LHNLPPQSQQPCTASWACFEVDAERLDDDDVTYTFLAQQQIFHWLMQLLFPRYFVSVPPNTITRPCHDNPSEVELLFGNSFSTFEDDDKSSSGDDESSSGDDDSDLKQLSLDRVVENLPSAFSDAPPTDKFTELSRPTEVKTVGPNSRKPLADMTSQTTLPSSKTTIVDEESGSGKKFIKLPKSKPPGPRPPPPDTSSRKHTSGKGGHPQGIAELLQQNGLQRITNAGAGNCLPICLGGLLHNDDGSDHHLAVRNEIALEILSNTERYRESLVDEDFQEAQMTVETEEETVLRNNGSDVEYSQQRLKRFVMTNILSAGSYMTEFSISAFRYLHPEIHVCILQYYQNELRFSGGYDQLPPNRADGSPGRLLLHAGAHYEILEAIPPGNSGALAPDVGSISLSHALSQIEKNSGRIILSEEEWVNDATAGIFAQITLEDGECKTDKEKADRTERARARALEMLTAKK